MEIKEKKVAVELNGRRYWLPEHMLDDAVKLGASPVNKPIKNPPKELIDINLKELPKEKLVPEVVQENLPEMKITPKRKVPVRSKSTKI